MNKYTENWQEFILKDFVELNPKESLKKGITAKKIPMELLMPFCRDITTYEISKYSGGTKFKNDDTIMARITPCLENGKRARVSILDNNEIAFGSTEYIVFRARKGISDANFVYYLVCSDLIRKPAIKSMVGSSGRQRVQTDVIENLEFHVPPLPIQKKIAAVLSALDDKIELNNKINQNLEQQAQALFDTIYESKNNGILSDIVATVESGNRPKGGALAEGIPSIGAENIEKFGVYDYSKEKFIDAVFFEQMKRGKVKSEDVLLYKDGAYTGKVSLALDGFPHEVCAVNEHVFIIRAKQNVSSSFFLYFCLYNKNNRDYLYKLASSKAAQPGLNKEELLNLPIFIPDLQLIRNFSSNTAPMMHKIATNALENKKLAQLRDALLPKLMSGKIDVSKVNIDDFEYKILGGKSD